MGITDFWGKALGTFIADTPYVDASEFSGKRFAVDSSIWFNRLLRSNIDQLATTSTPPCLAPDLLFKIKSLHDNLSQCNITLVYVYDGKAPPHKDATKKHRVQERERHGAEWIKLCKEAKKDSFTTVDDATLKKATDSRMKMSHPTVIDHANILRWMKENNIECVGAIAEADQQMVQLEKDGVVHGIITTDGDIVALGAKRVLCKMSRKNNGQYQFKVFDREKFMHPENPYKSKLSTYQHLITDVALLLGNDYCPRIHGNGVVKVVSGENSIVDMLAGIDDEADQLDWIKKFGNNGLCPISHDHADVYWKARKYMLHAPVLTCNPLSGEVSVVPLNPLPTDSDWDYIDMQGFLNELGDDDKMIQSIYHCDVVPLERKPIEFYRNKLDAPMFSDLDFDAVPIEIQPTLCIVNWLRARGLDVRVSDTREKIESCVDNCLRNEKPINGPPLKPIAGLYDGFRKIISRQAGNEYDTPNPNYFFIAAKLHLEYSKYTLHRYRFLLYHQHYLY
eukprot:scaffold15816_cov70-Cyclotella_meneghiniana.AAC.16